MFAFAAAIVLGAFTLASCGDDDDDNGGSGDAISTFTISFKTKSEKPGSEQVVAAMDAVWDAKIKEMGDRVTIKGTNLQADALWMNTESWAGPLVQTTIDEAAKDFEDKTLSVTMMLIKDGKTVYKEKVYTPNPLLFL